MTSHPSAANSFGRPAARRGFSLVELLVVIGILVLLLAITLAFIGRAQKQAEITRARSELASVSAAIEQFKVDHGFYPVAPPNLPAQPVLAEALLGPGDENEALRLFGNKKDGVNGPGFNANGKNWSAYLPAETFKAELEDRGASITNRRWLLLDRFNHPIVYLPKRKNLPPATVTGSQVPLVVNSTAVPSPNAFFNLRDGMDNSRPPRPPSSQLHERVILAIIGDVNYNRQIDAGETFSLAQNYILASPGPDREFTKFENETGENLRTKLRKSDDVFNIDF